MDEEISTTRFNGFHDDDMTFVHLPASFFTQLLPQMACLTHIKLLLYLFWYFEQQEGSLRYFRLESLQTDPALLKITHGPEALNDALEALIEQGIILKIQEPQTHQNLYFINSPQGRAAVESIENNTWKGIKTQQKPIHLQSDQPNIYKLYEENIGVITPMMAEILKDDETTYPDIWIKEAIRIAVKRNARNWKYVQAILERWQKEGRGNEQNQRNDSQDPGSYRESWLGHD